MAQAVDRPGMDKIRLGSWMMIAGTLGAVLALLTWIDVWNASDSKPTGWALVGVACAVLALGGFAVFWQGLTIKSRASGGATPGATVPLARSPAAAGFSAGSGRRRSRSRSCPRTRRRWRPR